MWVVVKTKPNQKVRAKYNLNNQGFNTYLPILRQKNSIEANGLIITK